MAIIIKYEILPQSESQVINKWVRIQIDILCEEVEVPSVNEFISTGDVETFNGKQRNSGVHFSNRCKNCGSYINYDLQICPKCGSPY